MEHRWWWCKLLAFLSIWGVTTAYQVLISDLDESRQVCSGMWAKLGQSRDPYIEVFFGPSSKGQVSVVIYEWSDAKYLGVDESHTHDENDWDPTRTFVCTIDAVARGFCTELSLGKFIITLPKGKTTNSTSIWTERVEFASNTVETMPGPFRYNVTKTGYYCVGTVPLTTAISSQVNGTIDSVYTGYIEFQNVFEGFLPASEYPKVAFYATLIFIYLALGTAWALNYWRHRPDILPVQNYISATIVFLIFETFCISAYYKYLNDGNHPTGNHLFLVIVSILSAARNAVSFFMLLIVSLGYSIVKPSLGSIMRRVRILAVLHFVFGVMYSIGMVVMPFESAGLVVFFMVFPLAFTLTGFMMWIMAALSATIQDLEKRKQTFKKQMFIRLYRILMGAAIVIVAFFVISSVSFSNRLDQDFAPSTWKTRWFLVDGWLGLLYLGCFAGIAYLWRPTRRNRYLAMSDEIAQDELEADEFDDRALRSGGGDDDGEDGKWGSESIQLRNRVGTDDVVFDIGDDEDEVKGGTGVNDDERKHLRRSLSTEQQRDAPPAY